MEQIENLITVDPETLGGQPVFKGTRVPVESLFDYFEEGISLNEFLYNFDTVSKDQAIAVMKLAGKIFSSKRINELYAAVA